MHHEKAAICCINNSQRMNDDIHFPTFVQMRALSNTSAGNIFAMAR